MTKIAFLAAVCSPGEVKTSFQPPCSVQPATPSDMLTTVAPFATSMLTPLVMSVQLAVPVWSNGL